MKRYFLFLALAFFAFVACENQSDNGDNKPSEVVFRLKSATEAQFSVKGGMGTILFELRGGDENDIVVNVSDSVEWVSDIKKTKGRVTYKVAANDGDARDCTITLVYGAESREVKVLQGAKGDDVIFVAEHFDGVYFGENNGVHNYYVLLSDIGAKKFAPQRGGTYYVFDIYSDKEPVEGMLLPNGTYVYDLKNTYAAGTVAEESSWVASYDEDGKIYNDIVISSATLTVTDGKIVAEIVADDENMTTYRPSFEGLLSLYDDTALTTLYEDFIFDITGAEITATYHGVSEVNGAHNWFVEVIEKSTGNYFQFDLMKSERGDCYGYYTPLIEVYDFNNKFLVGVLTEDNKMANSWYCVQKMDGGKVDTFAPLIDGAVNITAEEEGVAKIQVKCEDDLGNKIDGTIRGEITIKDATLEE